MTERLTWTKLADGDLLCHEHPIRLDKPLDRHADTPGWMILVPAEDGSGVGDDWWWRPVPVKGETMALEANSERDARALVIEHLDHVLQYIAQVPYPGWTPERRAAVIEYATQREAEWQARKAESDQILATARANRPAPAPAKPKGPSAAQMRKMLVEALDLLDRARPMAVSQLGKDSWLMRRDALREQAQAKGVLAD